LELEDGSNSKTDIQEMKALVNRGAGLTKQLLGFARLGKYDLKPLDLARVVAKTSAMYGRARTDITIQLDFAPGLLAVLMDHSQLEQVLLNLLVNAGQAMPQGGHLLLHAENADLADGEGALLGVPPGLYAKLLVTDTGSGMDAKTMGRIFEPFFTTKGPGEGTGLGLASVYGIIKNHAGFIGVESEKGKGTTFTLLLPATERQVAEDKTPVAVLQHGTGTILVVDDEAQIVKVCSRLLQKFGYEVLTAPGGKASHRAGPAVRGEDLARASRHDHARDERPSDLRGAEEDRAWHQGASLQWLQHRRTGPGTARQRLQRLHPKALRRRGPLGEGARDLEQGGAMGDADDGAGGRLQLRIQPLLVLHVEGAGGLVEHGVVRFGQQHAGHG
jgi:hypothetical protein